MSIIIRRFFELLGGCIALSVGIMIFYSFGFFNRYKDISIGIGICLLFFVLYNIYAMYSCYLFLISKWRFYLYNYTSYILFAAVTYICFFILDSKTYLWFFGITKLLYFSGEKALWLITVFHIVMVVAIAVLPVGVHYIGVYQEESKWITDVFDDK